MDALTRLHELVAIVETHGPDYTSFDRGLLMAYREAIRLLDNDPNN